MVFTLLYVFHDKTTPKGQTLDTSLQHIQHIDKAMSSNLNRQKLNLLITICYGFKNAGLALRIKLNAEYS